MDWKKLIPALIVFLVGSMFIVMGALFKILHWGLGPVSAPLLLAIGSVVQVVAFLMAIIILLRMRR